mgnify:CR=1 FL=1
MEGMPVIRFGYTRDAMIAASFGDHIDGTWGFWEKPLREQQADGGEDRRVSGDVLIA